MQTVPLADTSDCAAGQLKQPLQPECWINHLNAWTRMGMDRKHEPSYLNSAFVSCHEENSVQGHSFYKENKNIITYPAGFQITYAGI